MAHIDTELFVIQLFQEDEQTAVRITQVFNLEDFPKPARDSFLRWCQAVDFSLGQHVPRGLHGSALYRSHCNNSKLRQNVPSDDEVAIASGSFSWAVGTNPGLDR